MTTEGNVIHYGYIEDFIEELGTKYNIREIAYDRWGAVHKVRDGTAAFDNEHFALQEQERVKEDYRQRRETECFSVINRGQLWYEGITLPQLLELRSWYKAWLNVTETLVVPEKPAWLD